MVGKSSSRDGVVSDSIALILDAQRIRAEAVHTCRRTAALLARLAPSEGRGRTSLSAREEQTLHLLSQGLTTKGIAAHMGVSGNTVKYYLTNVYRKLAVRSRVEAATAFHQMRHSRLLRAAADERRGRHRKIADR